MTQRLQSRETGHTESKRHTARPDMVARGRKTITVESVDFKAEKHAKTNQAWRYPGGRIVRHPDLIINGKRYEDHKNRGEPRRKQESNLFLTINTNKSPGADERLYCEDAMKHCLRELEKDENLALYLKFGPAVKGPPDKNDPTDYRFDRYNDVIHTIQWRPGIEYGGKQGRLHAHVWLTITHYSQIQINCPVLQNIFKRMYNEQMAKLPENMHYLKIDGKPYVQVKRLPQLDWTDVMRAYIHKGMTLDNLSPSTRTLTSANVETLQQMAR